MGQFLVGEGAFGVKAAPNLRKGSP